MPKSDKVKEAFDLIEKGVKDVYTSDKYRNYLMFLSKFHQYSFNNTMLILSQYPEASLIAGYRSWESNFNRHVNKGAKAIKILAPYKVKIKQEETDKEKAEDNDVQIQVTRFRLVNVFDISQTDGEPLPELIHDLTGTSDSIRILIESIQEACSIPIEFKHEDNDSILLNGAKGYYSKLTESIVINDNLEDKQKVKTLIHEYSHSLLHKSDDKAKEQKEIEAESLAFVICNHFGIDTSEYSFVYVASYAEGDPEILKNTLLNIQSSAHEIISKIEPIYERKLKEMINIKDITDLENRVLSPIDYESLSKGLVEQLVTDVSENEIYRYLRSREALDDIGREKINNHLNNIVDNFKDIEPIATHLYNENNYFKDAVQETVFLRCYLDLFDPNIDRPFIDNSIQRENYNLLERCVKPFLDTDADYVKMSCFNNAMMNLNVEVIGKDAIALSHYYELNGDMMADPDMEFEVDYENKLLYPKRYQQDNINIYQTVDNNPRLENELNKFTNQWLNNIKSSYRIKEMNNDQYSIKLDNKGRIIEQSGKLPNSVVSFIKQHEVKDAHVSKRREER